VITCPKCSKDNQDHYKFCLGCGAELPRETAPKAFSPQTPPGGMPVAKPVVAPPAAVAAGGGGGGLGSTAALTPGMIASPIAAPKPIAPPPVDLAPPPAVEKPAPAEKPKVNLGGTVALSNLTGGAPLGGKETVICPQCGHVNGPNNLFCGSCGFRLGGAQRAPAPAAPAAPVDGAGAGAVAGSTAMSILLTALRADGSEAGTFQLQTSPSTVGRETGGVFAGDSYLSPRHATFRNSGGRVMVKDEASLNGVYKKLSRDVPVELKPSDVFRIGQEIVRFEALTPQPASPDGVERLGAPSKGYVGRIALVIGREETGNAFPIPEGGVHLGRERGDILFPEDGYVSGLHCRLSWEGGRLLLTDLGSSNGTFLRLREETEVRSGDVLLMGQQLFRLAM
jgi:pSer/pThr/pTyr-binding forkhead associated (FHA) protein